MEEKISIPLKPLRKILKKYHKGEISIECCIEFRSALLRIADILANAVENEFQKQNQTRLIQNLPITKRLDVSLLILCCGDIFKDTSVFNTINQERTSDFRQVKRT